MSRLENTGSQLSVLKDNISAANSRIKDVDVAEESANFAKQNILVQSGTAMLAQANALPQSALRLIG
jgi:flagellin